MPLQTEIVWVVVLMVVLAIIIMMSRPTKLSNATAGIREVHNAIHDFMLRYVMHHTDRHIVI